VKLSVGQRVGSFEVSATLGKGGMGEVWQATDERFDRDVALKVLPEDFVDELNGGTCYERGQSY
jgi:serine/threonine-protein kinase